MTAPVDPPAREADVFPASPAQQRMWFIEELHPGTAEHHIAWATRLRGTPDMARLEGALQGLVARHEALRTRFVERGGVPLQLVEPACAIPLRIETLDASTDGMAVKNRLEREAAEPFDLGKAPLMRAFLLRLSSAECIVIVTLHHLVADGWSVALAARELAALYRGATLPPLPLHYADLASWQQRSRTEAQIEPSIRYWRERLKGLAPLDLPLDHPRPPVRDSRGGLLPFEVPADLAKALFALARAERCTMFVLLLTAFQVLLARLTRQVDIAVGCPITDRTRVEMETVVGLFVNTLVLRADLGCDPAFRDALARGRDDVLQAYEHRAVPFERLVEHLSPERDLSTTPLFQVMFAWQEAAATLDLDGLSATRQTVSTGASKFDLTLELLREGDGLAGQLEYSTALFERETVEALLGHFVCLLGGIAASPGARLSRLPLLGAAERARLLAAAAGPPLPADAGSDLVAGFAAAARAHPRRIALSADGQAIAYADLEDQSARLAYHLRTLGVGPETRVGLCLDPSAALIVAMLGILRAGGAYVALDPVLPDARLATMAGDARVALVVTDAAGRRRGQAAFGHARLLAIEDRAWREAPAQAPAGAVLHPDQLAYVLYTSGSTGVPKGVGITHRNVNRLFAVTRGWAGFGPDDVWALCHAFGFDMSVWEIWGALLFGGRLVVVPYWVRRAPAEVHALLRDSGVTVLNQTPSAFRQLRAHGGRWDELAVRLVVCAGEELRYEDLAGWAATGIRLVNMYGITETTVHATRCEVGDAELSGARAGGIGRPLDDLRLYVLDPLMQPVPRGVPGELYVGGRGVGRGYVGRPRLTAERFLPDPFGHEPGARLYRSGDIVRTLPDGSLAYRGRADRQVKVRGHRIELGEVEAALLAAGLREAVVDHQRDTAGLDRLVAYAVGEPQPADTLRATLARRLPPYMLPSAVVWLDRLPLTAHGKLDRRALPAPAATRPDLAAPYTAPRTPAEAALAAVWATVLRLDAVGVHDSFFSLGGDSIRSLQLQALAARKGLPFTLEQLFRTPTIAALAEAIHTTPDQVPFPSTKPFDLVDPGLPLAPDIEDAYPLTQLQAGMLFHITLAPDTHVYHNTGGRHVRSRLRFDADAFRQAVRVLVRNHAVFRTSFDLHSYGEPLQLVHREAVLPLEIVDLRHLSFAAQDEVLDALLDSERVRPFDLSRPTLLRLFVHLRTDTSFQFSLTECHAIYDGWSYHSAIVELFNIYAGLVTGRPVPPPAPLAVTFRDFVALERQVAADPVHRDFWMRTLEGCTVTLLPQATPAPAGPGQTAIRTATVPLLDEVSDRLQSLARHHGLPLKSLLLAAHVKALSIVCGTGEVLTGLVANGRPDGPDGDRLFGLFLNSIPFRLPLAPGRWLDLVRAVYAHEADLLPHRRVPLRTIQEVSGRHGLCDETLFNYLDFHVYDDLDPALGFELLGGNNAEGSNITLSAHFQRRTLVSGLRSGVLLQLDYDSLRLSARHAEAIGQVYGRVLNAMADHFLGRHDARPLAPSPAGMTAPARPARTAPRGILAGFRHWVETTPDAVATVGDDAVLTYRELDERAARLAAHLAGRGAGPEVRVGVCLTLSSDLIVALLAVWATGAAFVPLDAGFPSERLRAIVDHGGLRTIVTSPALQARHGFPPGLAVGPDAGEAPRSARQRQPDATVRPGNLAYLAYTSGSSGQPKGCETPRGSFENLIAWYRATLSDRGPVRSLIVSSFGFDLTLKNLFAPLTMGGSVHLPPSAVFDSRALCEAIERQAITVVNCTPTAFGALLDAAAPGGYRALRSLRSVVLGGEALSRSRLRPWLDSPWCEARVMNSYGPAECTDASSGIWLDLRGEGLDAPVPVGPPVDGGNLLILDPNLHPVPQGTPGELCVAGTPLGRGYAGDPRLTALRFRPNPFATEPGERLYRTGDRARQHDDGTIEVCGRLDRQIKIRGFRVEPAEIERLLEDHPEVRWAHVRLVPGKGGGDQLFAYILAASAADGLEAALRASLRRCLPEYMVPSGFVRVEAVPFTANGKLDDAALGRLQPRPSEPDRAYQPPQGLMEAVVASQWCRALDIERIGRSENVFDAGGHSLHLLQVHQRLEHQLGRTLPLLELFNHPTVAALARYLDASGSPPGAEEGDASPAMARRRGAWGDQPRRPAPVPGGAS